MWLYYEMRYFKIKHQKRLLSVDPQPVNEVQMFSQRLKTYVIGTAKVSEQPHVNLLCQGSARVEANIIRSVVFIFFVALHLYLT